MDIKEKILGDWWKYYAVHGADENEEEYIIGLAKWSYLARDFLDEIQKTSGGIHGAIAEELLEDFPKVKTPG